MVQNSWVGSALGGRYRIEELLGQGGMSAVYKAVDPNLRREVAIKLIHPHLSTEREFVRRFEEEAAAVAQLRHPNIVQVFDFNHDQGTYYMVLEYVPGETLQNRLARLVSNGQSLSYLDAIRYAIQVCDAVDYAHKRNMIHRDIKPANVIIDPNERAILMDFGIAKILGGQQHTATGAVIGTALYMSPEQIRGERVDHRSDIYSIGVMLYEMVNGRPPFEADSTMTLMMKHLNDPVPDLRSLRPDLPEVLVAMIEKALMKTPGGRFQSAEEMARALRKAFDDLQSQPGAAAAASVIQVVDPQANRVAAMSAPSISTAAAASSVSSASPSRVSSSATRGAAPATATGAASSVGQQKWFLLGGAGIVAVIVFLCLAASGVLLAGRMVSSNNGQRAATSLAATQTSLAIAQGALLENSSPTPAFTPEATFTAVSTELQPSSTSVVVASPTAGGGNSPAVSTNTPSVVILTVTLEGDTYVVAYETVGFIENIKGRHIHFYFNNITPEQAALGGSGPYVMYGGPRPFNGLSTFDRPADATQICAIVTNPDHSGIPNSGNCVDLPEPAGVTPALTMPTPTPKPPKTDY